MGINGDDAVELFANGTVIDTFGDPNTNGDGETWDYTDSWAYRVDNTGPDATYVDANWTNTPINTYDGTNTNAEASPSMPVGTYTNNTLSTENFENTEFSVYPNPASNGFVNITTASNEAINVSVFDVLGKNCLLYTSPSPRDGLLSRMPSSA